MPLSRPYQNDALEAIREDRAAGLNSLLLVMATGLGKTVVLSHLPTEVLDLKPGDQMVVLVHRDELAFQSVEKLERYNPGLKISMEKAQYRSDPDSDIIVASVQTIGKAGESGSAYCDRIKSINPDRVVCVVIDEAHHAACAETYLRILRYLRVMKGDPARNKNTLLLGVTATPNRSDNIGLEVIFDKITFDYGIEQACQDGVMIEGALYPYLAKPVGHRVNTDVSLKNVKITAGDFNIGDLGKTINTPERNNLIVDKYLELGGGQQFMCFTVDIQHAHDISAAFFRRGISCYPVSGKTPPEERKKFLRLFNEGAAGGLASCAALSEGSDLPRATVGLMARPTKSSSRYIQEVGRVLRPFPSPEDYLELRSRGVMPPLVKHSATIIDFCDSSARHSLVTIPTLFGLRPEFDLKGESAPAVAAKIAEIQKKQPGLDLKQYSNLEDIKSAVLHVDLFRPPVVPEVARKHSKFSWLEIAPGCYSINVASTGSSLQIREDALGKYEVAHTKNGVRAIHTTCDSLPNAFAIADGLVPPADTVLLKTNAAWHKEGPTDKQCNMLWYRDRDIKRRYKSSHEFYKFAKAQFDAGNLSFSKGSISRLIDKATHAGGGA